MCSPRTATDVHSIDDYDVFKSPLSDFQREVAKTGWQDRVIYLTRGEEFAF